MPTERVSCIIPVWNAERFLGAAIDSVIRQSHPVLEIIVVDDGSTDRTADVARSFGGRIIYRRQDNAGPAGARNQGLSLAQGELMTFLDADDLWEPEKVARQVSAFAARPRLEVLLTLIQNFWEPEVAEEGRAFEGHRLAGAVEGYVSSTMMARREVFEKLGRFNGSVGHRDFAEWYLKAKDSGVECDVIGDVLVRRRLHRDNRSRTGATDSRDEFLKLVKQRIDQARARRVDRA